jgi:hypothetical protein
LSTWNSAAPLLGADIHERPEGCQNRFSAESEF